MPAAVGNYKRWIRDSRAEITKPLKRIPDGASKFAKLLIVETTTY
jgi:hypothetical protein